MKAVSLFKQYKMACKLFQFSILTACIISISSKYLLIEIKKPDMGILASNPMLNGIEPEYNGNQQPIRAPRKTPNSKGNRFQ